MTSSRPSTLLSSLFVSASPSLTDALGKLYHLDAEKKKGISEAAVELTAAVKPYENDRARLLADLDDFAKQFGKNLPTTNEKQHTARKAFDPIAEHMKDLVKQVDVLYKLTARITDLSSAIPRPLAGEGRDEGEDLLDARPARRLLKQLDEERKVAVEQLKQAAYFHRQIVWLAGSFS